MVSNSQPSTTLRTSGYFDHRLAPRVSAQLEIKSTVSLHGDSLSRRNIHRPANIAVQQSNKSLSDSLSNKKSRLCWPCEQFATSPASKGANDGWHQPVLMLMGPKRKKCAPSQRNSVLSSESCWPQTAGSACRPHTRWTGLTLSYSLCILLRPSHTQHK